MGENLTEVCLETGQRRVSCRDMNGQHPETPGGGGGVLERPVKHRMETKESTQC